MTRRLVHATVMAALLLAACSDNPERFEDKVTRVRKQGHALEHDLRSVAMLVRDMPVLWADGKIVRYWAEDGQARSEAWSDAVLDRDRADKVKAFLRRNDLALYVRDRRVWFSVTGIGERYEGRAAGWGYVPAGTPDCNVVPGFDLTKPGLQCMEFSPALFVYVNQ